MRVIIPALLLCISVSGEARADTRPLSGLFQGLNLGTVDYTMKNLSQTGDYAHFFNCANGSGPCDATATSFFRFQQGTSQEESFNLMNRCLAVREDLSRIDRGWIQLDASTNSIGCNPGPDEVVQAHVVICYEQASPANALCRMATTCFAGVNRTAGCPKDFISEVTGIPVRTPGGTPSGTASGSTAGTSGGSSAGSSAGSSSGSSSGSSAGSSAGSGAGSSAGSSAGSGSGSSAGSGSGSSAGSSAGSGAGSGSGTSTGSPTCKICALGTMYDGRSSCVGPGWWGTANTCDYLCTDTSTELNTACQGASYVRYDGVTCNLSATNTIPDLKCPSPLTSVTSGTGKITEDARCWGSYTMTVAAECPPGSTFNGTRCETAQIAGGTNRYTYSCTGIGKCEGTSCSTNFITSGEYGASFFSTWGGECTRTAGPSSPASVCPWGFTWNGSVCVSDFTPYCATNRPTPTATLTLTANGPSGPAVTRTQRFNFGGTINPGDAFTLMVYSHPVYVVAVAGDTPTTLATKMAAKINATTDAQWNDHNSRVYGAHGVKPAATSSGSEVTIVLNWQNQFGANVW